ncbi:MAG TPA: CoA transferase [Acidimicrobiia bacterium]|nr:CoA transferase [Acidimicrobiia bacterium]
MLGVSAPVDGPADPDPADDWAASGAMFLTGEADGPPRVLPGPVCARLRGCALALNALSGVAVELDAPALLGERAAIAHLGRQGTTSPGGSCRLLRAHDGWIALNLARRDDVAMVPALLARELRGDPWAALEEHIATQDTDAVVERAQLLGVPASVVALPRRDAHPFTVTWGGRRARRDPPLVVDLSALWAGPLCGSLLALAGCDVVKVETPNRPDGARRGPARFFDLMNAGKRSVCVELGSPEWRALVDAADVVVDSSRPRVMHQLGVDVDALVALGTTWVSFTGYGRAGPWRDRVAFGDDAAAAGGPGALLAGDDGVPMVCADAFADPVAGLHGAVAALACLAGDRGALVDVSLRDAVSTVVAGGDATTISHVPTNVALPRARTPAARGPALGRHTGAVLAQLGVTRLE